MPRCLRALSSLALCFCLVGVGCANTPSSSSAGGGDSPEDTRTKPLPSALVDDPNAGVDWEHPIQDGVKVGSLDDAMTTLQFDAVVPADLPGPAWVMVTGPADEAMAERALAIGYDTKDYGRVVVLEAPAQETPDEWYASAETLVEATGTPGYYGSAELVDLANGTQALLTTSADGKHSTMMWVEAGTEVAVQGPSLDREGAVEYSDLIVG